MAWWSGWRQKAERLRRLGPAGVAGVAEAWLTVAWMDIAVSWLPYALWRSWLGPARSRSRARNGDPARLASWVEIGARHYPRPVGCLQRALALRAVLSRRGLSARVRIGVRRAGETLLAHAWVDHDGRVINDAPDVGERYLPLERWTGERLFLTSECTRHPSRVLG
jgi:hypothetical protein